MDNYILIGEIGSGSFGKISKVQRKSDGKIFARKEINYTKMNEREKMQVVTEVNILRELKHESIVKYYERAVDKEKSIIYIIMEYCDLGDLGKLIKDCKKHGKYLEENAIWKIFSQIVSALHYCHNFSRGIILHRDIKPSNILLDKTMKVKLCDFGLSRILQGTKYFAKTFVGTPYYMSPEQISENLYDEKSDIWSLGCLLYEMCCLVPPFDARSQTQLTLKITKGKFEKIPSHYSDTLESLVMSLIQTDADKRPTTLQLVQISKIRNPAEHEISLPKVEKMSVIDEREKTLLGREERLQQIELDLIKREKKLEKKEEEFNKKVKEYYFGLNSENSENRELTPKTPLEFIKQKIIRNQSNVTKRSPLRKINN